MATAFTAADETIRIVLSAVADELTKVTFEPNARTITIFPKIADGTTSGEVKVAQTGTDGAAIGAAYVTVVAGQTITIGRGKDRNLDGHVLYLASATASAVIEVRSSSQIGG